MLDNRGTMEKIHDIAVAWQMMQGEHKINQLTDDQIDLVTDVALDRIRKVIAEHEKA